ncbi:Groel-like equatorial domain, partial [Globisporangium splendens]
MDELERAVEELSSIAHRCFGPCGEETLLFAPPDPPLVTADGHALLSAWQRGLKENRVGAAHQEPMQMYILNAVDGLFAEIGDGTSQFVLLLYGAVRHAMDAIRHGHSQQQLQCRQWSVGEWRQLATAFGDLKRECRALLDDFRSWQPDLRVVMSVEFVCVGEGLQTPSNERYGKYPSLWVVRRIGRASVVEDRVDARFLFHRVQQFVKAAPRAITFAIALSLYDSQILPLDEFILRKSSLSSQSPSILDAHNGDATTSSPLRFICLTCPLSLTFGSNHVTIRTNDSHEALFQAHDATRVFMRKFVRDLRLKHDVRLLVSAEAIDASVAEMCTQQGIACVQFAEHDEVMDLCTIVNTYPLASLFDAIEAAQHIDVCRGGVPRVRLQQSDEEGHARVAVPQLILNAPTKGVYKQYYKVITKALRILQSWCEPSAKSSYKDRQFELYSCRGGGATELALARQLQTPKQQDDAVQNTSSPAAQLARRIFADALMEVVVTLRGNLGARASSDESDDFNNQRRRKRTVLQDMATLALHDNAQQHIEERESLQQPLRGTHLHSGAGLCRSEGLWAAASLVTHGDNRGHGTRDPRVALSSGLHRGHVNAPSS